MSKQPPTPSASERYAALKQDANKKKITDAYAAYARRDPRGEDELLSASMNFIKGKLRYKIDMDPGFRRDRESAETADDWTQDAILKVWEALQNGSVRNQTPDGFFAWLNKITFNKVQEATAYKVRQRHEVVAYSVVVENEDGDLEEIENPAVHSENGWINTDVFVDDDGHVIEIGDDAKLYQDLYFASPEPITGTNLRILEMKIRGESHQTIADELGLPTEQSVTQRLRRMRKAVEERAA